MVEIFTTCPQAADGDPRGYVQSVIAAAQWSERWGCTGMLVYSDNRQVDPWLTAQLVLQHTEAFSPLVAVQPVYMHPYAVAKMVATFAHMYGRRIYLNMVAGGFKNDLTALNDATPHDRRYDRLVEYTHIVRRLVAGGAAAPVTWQGEFYAVNGLKLVPGVPPDLVPGIFVSGSSEAGRRAAEAMGATAVKYPKAPHEETEPDEGVGAGVRVGVLAREDGDEAWAVARARFPEDRRGQLTHQLAMKVSDSAWHRQLSASAQASANAGAQGAHPYWLVPFENYKTMCPYLVGSYARVGEELARYVALGYRAFILDIPPDEDELRHTMAAFQHALERVAS